MREQDNWLIVRLCGNICKGKLKAHFSGYCLRRAAELCCFAEYRLHFGDVSWSVVVSLLKCWSTVPKTADKLTFGILLSQAQQQLGFEGYTCTDIWSLNTELLCVVCEEIFVLLYCLCSIVSTRVIAGGQVCIVHKKRWKTRSTELPTCHIAVIKGVRGMRVPSTYSRCAQVT